jgi:hypothetical protein
LTLTGIWMLMSKYSPREYIKHFEKIKLKQEKELILKSLKKLFLEKKNTKIENQKKSLLYRIYYLYNGNVSRDDLVPLSKDEEIYKRRRIMYTILFNYVLDIRIVCFPLGNDYKIFNIMNLIIPITDNIIHINKIIKKNSSFLKKTKKFTLYMINFWHRSIISYIWKKYV